MKATDLMIGDWVLQDELNVPVKIQSIMCHYANEDVYFYHEASEYISGVHKLQPIPLTSEILEKNGFRYSDLPFECFYEGYGLQIHGGNYADRHSNWYIICGINVAMNVTYVHELQHALKLCKIDKEIVL